MRYLIFAAFLAASCGDGPPVEVDDLARPPAVDMAEFPVVDLAQPPPVDMARPPACTAPAPGVYGEYLVFTYAPLSNPTMVTQTQSSSKAIVRNDGSFLRPAPAIAVPSDYHCDFNLMSVDPETCMAPCCAGQVGSPMFYFDALGWVLVIRGVCTFETASAITYSAAIVDGSGALVH